MAITIDVKLARSLMEQNGQDPDDAVRQLLMSLQVQTLHKILDDIEISTLGMSKTACKKACQQNTRFYKLLDGDASGQLLFERVIDHIQEKLSVAKIVEYLIWQGNLGQYLKVKDY